MGSSIASVLSWFGFAVVTMLAVVGEIELGSAEHVYGTAAFLLSVFVIWIGGKESAQERRSKQE